MRSEKERKRMGCKESDGERECGLLRVRNDKEVVLNEESFQLLDGPIAM